MFKNRVKKGEDNAREERGVVGNDQSVETAVSAGGVDGAEPKAYEKPMLIAYGDVRDVTLGPTNGEGESGAAIFFRVPPP